jgi:hypothetical protein
MSVIEYVTAKHEYIQRGIQGKQLSLFFVEQDAIIIRGPVVNNFFELKTGIGQLIDQDFLLDAMVFAVFRNSRYFAVFGMRRKIDDCEFAAGLSERRRLASNSRGFDKWW